MPTPATSLIPNFLTASQVVSLGYRLYRHYARTYFALLKTKRYRKNAAGLFIRWLFAELQRQPETPEIGIEAIQSRSPLCKLVAQRLTRGYILRLYLTLAVALLILIFIIQPLLEPVVGTRFWPVTVSMLGVLIVLLSTLSASLWMGVRLYLAGPVIFLECNLQTPEAVLSRVSDLQRCSGQRVWAIVLLVMITVWPLLLPCYSCLFLSVYVLYRGALLYAGICLCVSLCLSILSAFLVTPLHLILQTVLYHDLKCRREGMDLQLASR